MAASTTLSYHVSGPVILQAAVGALTVGVRAYANVGVCEDGIDLEFRPFQSEIKHDGGGGPSGDAVEFIFLNWSIMIRCTLVPFAGTYMNVLHAMSQGLYRATATGTEGVMTMPGTLYGQGNDAVAATNSLPAVKFTSSDPDGGWTINAAMITRPGSGKWSTRETKPQLEFRGINNILVGVNPTINTNVLYSRA